MITHYFNTFARVCLLPYIGGTILHTLRLIYNPQLDFIPLEIDWIIVGIGSYGGIGLVVFAGRIPFKSVWDKIAYGLLTLHLLSSVVTHAYIITVGNHNLLSVFPYWYSFIAVGYFSALGLYVLSLNRRLYWNKRGSDPSDVTRSTA